MEEKTANSSSSRKDVLSSPMAPTVVEFVFCLLPSTFVLLISLANRWSRLRCWATEAARAVGWTLWVVTCLILRLPLRPRGETDEAGWSGTGVSSGCQRSNGIQLICKPTALSGYLLQNCGSLAEPRLSAWPGGDPHLQTLSGLLCGGRGDALQFARDHLLLRDGGVVALDWVVGTRPGEAGTRRDWRKEHQPQGRASGCFGPSPPVLLLIPQSWGGVTPHLRDLCRLARQRGFYVVVFHPRGTAGCPLTTPRLTEFGDPADLEQAVAYVHSCHPSSKLVAVSEGSGSGLLLSYLGESGSSSRLTAAASISPVLLAQRWFETAIPPLYHWGALFHRKLQLSRYASSLRPLLAVDTALRSSSLKDFEETLFCSSSQPLQGQPRRQNLPQTSPVGDRSSPDWKSYWERNEPLRDADEVAVTVLCILSRDDPLLPPASSIPLPLFWKNPFFLLVLTDTGGHCGFPLQDVEDKEQQHGRNWSHVVVLEYFSVVADFLDREERQGAGQAAPAGEHQAGLRSRANNLSLLRRRRASMMRRSRPQTSERSSVETEEGNFSWKRSYTR